MAVKDKLTGPAFINLCEGLKFNTSIKELTFRLLGISDCCELSKALNLNISVTSLFIQCDTRVTSDNPDSSLFSSANSTNHSFAEYSHLLSQNYSVTTYTLGGYLNICPYLVLGLKGNKTVTKLILENIEIDRESVNL